MLEELLNPYHPLFWVVILVIIGVVFWLLLRPFLTTMRFVYPTAKYEAMGNPYVKVHNLRSLLDGKNLEGFKETLNAQKDYHIDGETLEEVHHHLDALFYQTVTMMQQDSSKSMQEFYHKYIQKHELYHIKTAVKNILTDTIKDIPEYTMLSEETQQLLKSLHEVSKEDLPEFMKHHDFPDELVEELRNDEPDLTMINMLFDQYFLTTLDNVSVPYKCGQVKDEFIKRSIDMISIKQLLRAKQLNLPKDTILEMFLGEGKELASWKYHDLSEAESVSQVISGLEGTSYYPLLKEKFEYYSKDNSVQILENAIDRQFLHHIRDISIKNYSTMGPSLRFLVSKEYELRNLKIIAKGIAEQLDANLITPWLVTEEDD